MPKTIDEPAAEALAWVPGVHTGAPPLRVARLHGGSVNDCWRVDTTEGRFVLRIDGAAWRRPGVDRVSEQQLHAAAAAAGLAPRLLLRCDSNRVQVSEYLEGRSWSAADFSELAQLERLGERLAQLHALELPSGVAPFSPVETARQYLEIMGAKAVAAAGALAVVGEIDADAHQVAAGTAGLAIVHGDLAHGNLLDGSRLWLLDWEYAQLADPLYDVACALAYYPQARRHAARLLAASGLAGEGLPERLAAAIRVYEALSWLWHQARDAPGCPNPGP
jgi:thiamine kinase